MTDDERSARRRRFVDPDREDVFAYRESVGPMTQAGPVSPGAVSLLATGIIKGSLALWRGLQRLRR